MNRSADLTMDWGGEAERPFRLAIGQLRKLQEKTNCGPLGIAARCAVSIEALRCIQAGDYLTLSHLDLSKVAEKAHTREALLQGLLGANMPLPEADELVRDYVDERPLAESLTPAMRLCFAAVYGPEEDRPAGESEAAQTEAASQTSQTDASGSETAEASTKSAAH